MGGLVGVGEGGPGNEATDTELPYDPRVTGHWSQLEPMLNVASSLLGEGGPGGGGGLPPRCTAVLIHPCFSPS